MTTTHTREGATPQNDGTLLGDCICGATYSVPQGGDEFAALEAAQAAHKLGAIIHPVSGVLTVFTTDELEALVVTVADLWQNSVGLWREILSARQRELADRAREWAEDR